MSAALLAGLRQRGIQVSRVGDQLEVTGPADALSAGAVEYIRKHRAALLAALLTRPAALFGPPAVVIAAVEARSGILRQRGLSQIEAERQAVEELLLLTGAPEHESARCDLHNCPQRRLPGSGLFRCPACVPGSFARPNSGRSRAT